MSSRFVIPDTLIRTNTEQRGAPGVEWLQRLPSLLAECEQRWHLTIDAPFPLLSYNYAAPARQKDGTRLVVKVCFPGKEFRTEVDALRIYDGQGAVKLLDFDDSMGVMLLEHLEPGTMLVTVKDDVAATSIAASLMKRIRRLAPSEHSFPSVADWAGGMSKLRSCFGGSTGPFPSRLVEEAERLFSELLSSMGEQVVLHGDLHHFNILANAATWGNAAGGEEWLAIDPQGVIGEAEYETGALLRNPIPRIYRAPHLEHLLARRMDQLADELAFDRQRIRSWAVAQAMLSVWWYFEDTCSSGSDEWRAGLELAETMAKVR